MEKVTVTARIDGQARQQMQEIATRQDRTVSYLVRKAVEEFLARQRGEPAVRRLKRES